MFLIVANAKKVKSNKSKVAKKSKKPSLKKANTMVKTAKVQFLLQIVLTKLSLKSLNK